MTFVRIHAVAGIDTDRESALEIGERMLDATDVPGFIHGSCGITFHDDECDNPDCRGCAEEPPS